MSFPSRALAASLREVSGGWCPWVVAMVCAGNAFAAPCDSALELKVAQRLSPRDGPWLLRCLDDETFEVTRGTADSARARVVSLAGVSKDLRLEVVVLAARALSRLPAPSSPPLLTTETPRSEPERAPRVDVVVPRVEPGDALLARGIFQGEPDPRVRPVARAQARWFPLEGTWLAGGRVGGQWAALRFFGGAHGGLAPASTLQVSALVLEGAVSLALVCAGNASVVACLRGDVAGGAALLSGIGDAQVTTKSGWAPWLDAGASVEVQTRAGPLWLALALQVSGVSGPRAIVAAANGPGWSGLMLGLALEGGWQ